MAVHVGLGHFHGISAHLQVFLHGHVGEYLTSLRHVHNLMSHYLVGGQAADDLSVVLNGSLLRLVDAHDGLHKGCLACSVGSDDGDNLVVPHFDGHVKQSLDLAIIYVNSVYLKHVQPPLPCSAYTGRPGKP